MASTTAASEHLRQLSAHREDILRDLADLSETDCQLPAQWAGIQRNVNFLLRAYSLHELDHLQHLLKLMNKRGHTFGEPQILLSKAQALRGELMALLLSLSDEEFESNGGNESDWSPRQLVDHLAQVDQNYARTIREAVTSGRANGQAD